MMYYRILTTSVRPMPLKVSSKAFAEEYRRCWEDPERPTDFLYTMVQPFLVNWERMICAPGHAKDINYITMCRRLYPISENPQEMIDHWHRESTQTTSVLEELQMLFFARLRRLNYYPTRATPKMAEYVIAKDFRDRLKDLVVSARNNPVDIPVGAIKSLLHTEDVHPDYFLIEHLGLSAWEGYMLELLKLGKTSTEISALTHIPPTTLLREEQKIWRQLKQMWHPV